MAKSTASSQSPKSRGAIAPSPLVGRSRELDQLSVCLAAERSVLLEGPVGVGKTFLALEVAAQSGKKVFRVDGDARYTEQKLSGWFDPPMALKKGYGPESFLPGPLVEAMRTGGILFINELNRLPEGVQNVLLPALDEKSILVPRLGTVRAKKGFQVLATQNPKEFVATSHLSEAILDRFELITMDYQSADEETEIVRNALGTRVERNLAIPLATAAVRLARSTRGHPRIRRGASIRAALAVAELAAGFLARGNTLAEAFLTAVLLGLPTRIEIERAVDSTLSPKEQLETLLTELANQAMAEPSDAEKKKS